MKRSLKTVGLAALGVVALPALAAAQTLAAATTDLNIRTGPSPQHQVLGVIPGGQGAVIHDCTPAMTWCQVSYGGTTGWSYAPYLATQQGTVAHASAGLPPYAEAQAPPAAAGSPVVGIGAGALAGGLIAGPPGIVIGGVTGGILGSAATPRAHAHPQGTVAVAGPHPGHAQAPRARSGFGAHAGVGAGALAGGLIGGPPGIVIGGVTGGILGAGMAGTPYHTTR